MNTVKLQNKIVIENPENFKSKDTLECGQFFRYFLREDGSYLVYSTDKKAEIFEYGDKTEIVTSDVDYFENFFDLGRDYSVFEKKYQNIPFLKNAFEFGRGIRLLNQNLEETLFSFIISANNNIKRIKKIIENICRGLGENKGDYYAFPTARQMASADEAFFKEAGAGYRASYLLSTAKTLVEGFDLEGLVKLDTLSARKAIMSLKGVGPKVADCILLFGLKKCDSFPVDTWIEKAYHDYFETGLKNRNDISKYLCELFGEDAGYIQQYLFNYIRNFR